MIPGSDILAMALSIMEPTEVQWYAFTSRSVNAIGMDVATFAEPVPLEGSMQALPRAEYEKLGLDMAREYMTFYASANMQNSGRDRENDYVTWGGARYDVVNVTPWHGIDGWSEVLLVKTGATA